MRTYTDVEERRVRLRALVRSWTRSGLLNASQAEQLGGELAVELRQTNVYLRVTLAFFTLLIVAALVGFTASALNLRGDNAIAGVMMVAGAGCIIAAEVLTGALRLYRFGVEEMFAACAVMLFSFSVWQFGKPINYGGAEDFTVAFLVASAGGLTLYLRFGFVWAALSAMGCLAALPFQFDASPASHRAVAALLLAVVFALTRFQRVRHREEWPGDEYGVLQAAALAGVYLLVNVHLLSWWDSYLFFSRPAEIHGWFYWLTWALTWVLPAVGLALGLRDRDRPLLIVSIAMSIVTLATNKLYLGWERHTWDPMLLGVLLLAVALGIRRWLSRGPDGARHGFTATRIVVERDQLLTTLSAAPFPARPHAPAPAAPPAGFDGGRSGGGGASGTF